MKNSDEWVAHCNRHLYLYAMEKINLAEKFAAISNPWTPGIAGELNGQHVKLVKIKGEFVWHHHDNEDELFYVVKGSFDMHLRDRIITINEGEFLIVPRGVEHKPVAIDEAEVMLFEPAATINTGNIENGLTKKDLLHLQFFPCCIFTLHTMATWPVAIFNRRCF